MALATDGDAIVLSYAIADVGAFVASGDVVDDEAWRRGVTVYAPDGPARLYPPALSERAASLLPDGDRPAVVLTVVVDRAGQATLRSARRALVRSRAQLAYGPGPIAGLPPLLPELARRIEAADEARAAPGASTHARTGDRQRSDRAERRRAPPAAGSQRGRERRRQPRGQPGRRRPRWTPATADCSARCRSRTVATSLPLRRTAAAMGVAWPKERSLRAFAQSLDQRDPSQAAFLFAARRAGAGAG